MKPIRLLTLAALAPGLALAASVYRWVDGNGQVHYGQVPPPNAQYESLDPLHGRPAPAADAAGQEAADPGGMARFLKEVEARDKAEADAKAKAHAERAQQQAQCEEARKQIAYLEQRTARRLAVTNADGSVSRMDDDEFQKRLDAAKAVAAKNCR